mgnify:FL=1
MFEAPVVSVHIPPALRPWSGGHAEVTASGYTVSDVLTALGHEYPAIHNHLLSPSGELSSGLLIFLGGRSIRDLQGLETPIDLEEVMSIVLTGTA